MQDSQSKLRRAAAAISICLGLLCSFCSPSRAQSVDSVLDQSFHAMYNLQFPEALKKADEAKAVDKTDPLPWMAESCAVLFREFDRLHILTSEMFISDDKFNSRSAHNWDTDSRRAFEDALGNTEKTAQLSISQS